MRGKLLVLCVLLTGCFQENGLLGYKPKPWGLGGPPASAPAIYKKGWNDGCETGLAEFGTSAYKSFYKFKQDFRLVENPMYYAVWKQAEQYCKHYSGKWNLRPELEGPGRLFGVSGSPLCVICDPVDKYHGY